MQMCSKPEESKTAFMLNFVQGRAKTIINFYFKVIEFSLSPFFSFLQTPYSIPPNTPYFLKKDVYREL